MEIIENVTFNITIIVLGLSLCSAVFSSLVNRGKPARRVEKGEARYAMSDKFTNIFLVIAFLSLAASIVSRIIITGHGPFSNMYEFAIAFSLGILGAAYYFQWRYRINAIRNITVIASLVLLIFAATLSSRPVPLVPALQQSLLLSIHVASAMISYAALTVGFGASLVYVVKSLGDDSDTSLEVYDRLSYHTVIIGFPFLTLTIILGAVWADIAWGRYWGWDPKETASLVTWLVYAGYMHSRVIAGWRGRRSAILLIIGFIAILLTFFGNYVFSGLHAYQ